MPKGKKEITKKRDKRKYDKERYQRKKTTISIQRKEKYLKNSNSEKSLLNKEVKILKQELEQVNHTLHTSTQEKFHLELKLGKIIMLTLESLTMVYLELNQAFMDLENAKKDLNDAFEQNSKEKKVLEEKIKNYFETIQDLRSQVITLELENKESRELSFPLAQNLKSMILNKILHSERKF
jgi:chromosome segregation ATPase